ncbi:MAG: hypothetical protein MK098_09090 [Marinovum sp.]|nr:hypothetical protein [Marinovum sp.]
MSTNVEYGGTFAAEALKQARKERQRALSPREWKHRMAGFGYGIKVTAQGAFLTDLIGGHDVCALPAELGF